MKVRIPRWARILMECALLGALVLLFARVLDWKDIGDILRRITLRVVITIIAFQLLLQAMGTFQWSLILREAGIHRGPWHTFWSRVSGFAITYLTPSMYFGGEPVRASVYKDCTMSYERLYATIALDKYIELSSKFPCIIAGFALLVFLIHPGTVLVSVAGVIILVMVGFFVFLLVKLFSSRTFIVTFFKRLIRPLARVNPRIAVRVSRAIKEFARDVHELITRRQTFVLAMGTGVAVALVEVLQTWYILWVISPVWSVSDRSVQSFVIFATVFIQALIGLLPGNLGGMEGTHLVVFSILGIGSTPSLVYTIILRIGQATVTGLGILYIIAWRIRRARSRSMRPPDGSAAAGGAGGGGAEGPRVRDGGRERPG